MKIAAVVVVVFFAVSAAAGSVRAYSVEPVKQEWSGKAHPVLGVSEIITCCWDELDSTCYVELFGGAKGAGGGYAVSVYDGINLLMSSDGTNVPEYGWVTFENWDDSTYEFTKGKRYEFRFTRSGTDSDLVGLDCGPADATMA